MISTRGGVEDTRLEAKAKDRPSRGQGPRTQSQVFSIKKKRLQKFFFRRSQNKVFKNFFQAKKIFKNSFSGDLYLRKPKKRSLLIFRKVSGVFPRNFKGSKIMLSSSRGQGNFRGLEDLRLRTSKCVLEVKDVLEDSTSDINTQLVTSYLAKWFRLVFTHDQLSWILVEYLELVKKEKVLKKLSYTVCCCFFYQC